ncbi:MAG: FtsQ-type POTRA domain-containing protein [Ruminococcaceae bacterium]|nr:FtsQ-type POTRA domain-containing protein [Oscillospiraceae bacterium]
MKRKANRFEQNKSNIRNNTSAVAPKRKRRRRRSSAARITLVITVLLAVAVGAVLSLTVFFKIKSIDVYGETRYSSKEIIKAGNIALESNLIRLDSAHIANRIETQLPYIEEVKVKKHLPTTVELNVSPATVAGYISLKNEFIIVSTEGKVLEKLNEKPADTAEIVGVDVDEIKVSEYVTAQNNSMKYVKKIYEAFGEVLSKNITSVNVADRVNLSFVYRDRITVQLGSEADLAEKLKFVIKILSDPNKVSDDDMGMIYATNAKKISFLRKGSYSEYLAQLESEQQEQNDDTSSGIAQPESEDNPSYNETTSSKTQQ